MIECSFCSTSKCQRYLYAVCGHFVCVNCAALRAGETLQCCNQITVLEEQIKAQLKNKKNMILNNLQNGYEYEKTDFDRMGFNQLQQRLRKVECLETKTTRNEFIKGGLQIEQNQNREEMYSTPMDAFYKNSKVLQEPRYAIEQSTPIKLVQNTDQEDQIVQNLPQRNIYAVTPVQKPSRFMIDQTMQNQYSFNKEEFLPILQEKIYSVRSSFKEFYDDLQKMEANIVYQMKVYFEEYVKLVEKQSSASVNLYETISNEKQRVDTFLSDFVNKWSLTEIKDFICAHNDHSQQIKKAQVKIDNEIETRTQEKKFKYTQQIQPLQSCRLNYPTNQKKPDPMKDDFLASLRLSEQHDTQNSVIEPRQTASTTRNMDKIYKKLQQSRSKLQERIQIHNEFMSKRCLRMGNF